MTTEEVQGKIIDVSIIRDGDIPDDMTIRDWRAVNHPRRTGAVCRLWNAIRGRALLMKRLTEVALLTLCLWVILVFAVIGALHIAGRI